MNNDKNILDDFESTTVQKNELFIILTCIFICYILFACTILFFDLENFPSPAKNIDWQLTIVILILPVVGLPLFLKRKKAGWLICLFYFILVTLLIIAILSQDLYNKGFRSFNLKDGWKGFAIFLPSLISVSLLLSRNIRTFFEISSKSFRTAFFISLVISIIVIAMIMTE